MKGKVKIIDIESNGLLEEMLDHTSFPYKLKSDAKLHVVVIRDAYTDEVLVAEQEKITKEWMQKSLEGCEILAHHNGVKFDLITLKLFGVLDYYVGYPGESDTLFGKPIKIIDTLILSRLFYPDRYNGHSLESWGERTGAEKLDFRGESIAQGLIPKDSPKGFEFKEWSPLMTTYCIADTLVNKNTFFALAEEKKDYNGWEQAIKMEHKLADLAVRRESLGFWFDKEQAIKNLEDLTEKMTELQNKVNPVLPPKPMTKGELNSFTPPATQLSKDGEPSHYIKRFAERIGAEISAKENSENPLKNDYYITFENKEYKLPCNTPLKTHIEADISNLDHVKSTLIDIYKWVPVEWAERDFTKDSKKQSLTIDKRLKAFERWLKETTEGKYEKLRLKIAFENHRVKSIEELEEKIREKLNQDFPVRLPTSPKVRVGVEKDLCPNLTKLGEKVAFAQDFALYLTYKHRKSSIAGGELEDVDFDTEYPNTGYLSMYREEDGRVSTPAIEIGSATNRYRHIGIANVARASSIYGKEMRSLFGCGKDHIQLGFDFSSLENRVQGGYVRKYPQGEELAQTLLADKPNDLHCYSEDTEILTKEGWKTFGEISTNTFVAQYDSKTRKGQWVKPSEVVWQDYEGDMLHFSSVNTDQLLTPQHRVYSVDERTYNGKIDLATDIMHIGYKSRRFLCGTVIENSTKKENNDLLKLVIATQADGHLIKEGGSIKFGFVRQDKVDRLKTILDNLKADYKYWEHFRKGRTEKNIKIYASDITLKVREYLTEDKELSNKLLELCTSNRETLLNEVQYWDGTIAGSGIVLDITCGVTVNVLQSIACSVGVKTTITRFIKKTKWGVANIHRLFISTNVKCHAGIFGIDKKVVKYKGKVGCVSVPSTLVIVRRNGKVFVSGNTVNAKKLGISRTDAKSLTYAVLYGAAPKKVANMLNVSLDKGKEIFDNFWDAVPALKKLKENLTKHWEHNDKKWIKGIDDRKIFARSPHSLLNFLFQSAGVICAKYTLVYIMQILERQGYNIDCFKGTPEIGELISYHDECQLLMNPKLVKFKTFETETEAQEFKDTWKGEGQLSNIKCEKNYYIALPNPLSLAIEEATKKVEKLLDLKFNLAFEFDVHKNWYGCH